MRKMRYRVSIYTRFRKGRDQRWKSSKRTFYKYHSSCGSISQDLMERVNREVILSHTYFFIRVKYVFNFHK